MRNSIKKFQFRNFSLQFYKKKILENLINNALISRSKTLYKAFRGILLPLICYVGYKRKKDSLTGKRDNCE